MFEMSRILYFKEKGEFNTTKTLEFAFKRAQKLGIKNIIVPSTKGETGVKASELFKEYNLIIVTHVSGFREPDTVELTEENRKKISKNGGKIVTTTHAFGGIGRAIRKKFDTIQYDEIMANTLRIFGEGMKVACEITLMAADAGLIPTQEDAIAMGGSGSGVDTAIIIKPTNTDKFFEMRIKEILCKPKL